MGCDELSVLHLDLMKYFEFLAEVAARIRRKLGDRRRPLLLRVSHQTRGSRIPILVERRGGRLALRIPMERDRSLHATESERRIRRRCEWKCRLTDRLRQ